MSYGQALQVWHDFYITAGAAAATLVGLLFVGLSIHIRAVVSHREVRSLAIVTLLDFVVILLVSLVILEPAENSKETAGALATVAVFGLASTASPIVEGLKARRVSMMDLRLLLLRFGFSAFAAFGIVMAAALFWAGDLRFALLSLLALVSLLLVIAIRNTWDLLVTLAERALPSVIGT